MTDNGSLNDIPPLPNGLYDPQQMVGRDRNPYDWDNAKRMKEMRDAERK